MQIVYRTLYHRKVWRNSLLAIVPQLDMTTTDADGRSLLHVICDPASYTQIIYVWIHYPAHTPRARDAPMTRQEQQYRNLSRQVSHAFITQGLRKGNALLPDKEGHTPLMLLTESVGRNFFTLGVFEKLVHSHFNTIDWSEEGTDGNTLLHLLFTTEQQSRRRRYGKPVQTFARELAKDTAMSQHILSCIDLTAENKQGQSVISSIAEHCLHPRSIRESDASFWTGYRWTPEQFPAGCADAAEKLFLRWIRMRVPLYRSGTRRWQQTDELAAAGFELTRCLCACLSAAHALRCT